MLGRNRTIVGLKPNLTAGIFPFWTKSQSHHSGIETLPRGRESPSSLASQSHHSGIETAPKRFCVLAVCIGRNRTIVGLKLLSLPQRRAQTQLSQSHHSGIETVRPLMVPAREPSRNRTIVGLKPLLPHSGGPQPPLSQSHHSGIETPHPPAVLPESIESQSHHSGIEGVWLSWLTSYGPGVAEAAPGQFLGSN